MKIHIRESAINAMRKADELPKFLVDAARRHKTSLGQCPVYPDGNYDYTLLKDRFDDVMADIKEIGVRDLNVENVKNRLAKLVSKCKDIEKPIRSKLERVCFNTVNKVFAFPSDIVNLNCSIVDKIKLTTKTNVTPGDAGNSEYEFDDVDDMLGATKAVMKRRVLNAFVQGGAEVCSNMTELYKDDIDKIDKRLMPLYDEIVILNNYLLFTLKESMSDINNKQGAFVEVRIGGDGNKAEIFSQGVIFPLLLRETIRGFFELFAAHGLPENIKKAKYIMSKADFLLAEPWDARLGCKMWEKMFGKIKDTNKYPYIFMELSVLDDDEFMKTVKSILGDGKDGNKRMSDLEKKADKNSNYQQFKNRINAKNVDKSVISDGYFSVEDLSAFDLNANEDDGEIITET